MTREEIISQTNNIGHGLTFKAYLRAFNTEIYQLIYIPTLNWETGDKERDIDKLVTNYVAECINSFLSLDKSLFIEKL